MADVYSKHRALCRPEYLDTLTMDMARREVEYYCKIYESEYAGLDTREFHSHLLKDVERRVQHKRNTGCDLPLPKPFRQCFARYIMAICAEESIINRPRHANPKVIKRKERHKHYSSATITPTDIIDDEAASLEQIVKTRTAAHSSATATDAIEAIAKTIKMGVDMIHKDITSDAPKHPLTPRDISHLANAARTLKSIEHESARITLAAAIAHERLGIMSDANRQRFAKINDLAEATNTPVKTTEEHVIDASFSEVVSMLSGIDGIVL